MTASRTMSSIFSPLSTACASVSGTQASAAGSTRATSCTRTSRRRALTTRALHSCPRPSNTDTSSPTPRRSTRVRCSASSCGSSTDSSPASSVGAKKRCTTAIIRFQVPRSRFKVAGTFIIAAVFLRGHIIGKYKIHSIIGSGGFGTVYLADDTWIDKKVALKVPHKQGVDFGELLREPRLLAALNHPNIVSILTAEKQENLFFIVMEYVHGETLEAIITREGALDLNRSLDYICQICNAVDHAHRQGVLHRDLRPSNVLVGDNGRLLKVADFGTSRFLEIAAHGTTVIGSPPYMAPEQFHGKAVFASDVYSLGVTMYQMLTGMLPYDTPTPADLDRLMRGDLVSPPRAKNPKIPRALNDVILKAMAPDIHARYPRAGELLEAVLSARRSSARPTPRPTPSETEGADDIHNRLKARETPQPRFCWHCRKPLHARTDRCPFCGETQ